MNPLLDYEIVRKNLAFFVMRKQNLIDFNIKTKSEYIMQVLDMVKKMVFEIT